MEHHLWCNYFHRPAEGCEMCENLRKHHPDDKPDKMMKKYFPNAQLVDTGEANGKQEIQ